MISDVTDEIIEKLFNPLKIDIKIIYNPLEVVSFSMIIFSYCIVIVMKLIKS